MKRSSYRERWFGGVGDPEERGFREQLESRVENPGPSMPKPVCGSQQKKKQGTEKGCAHSCVCLWHSVCADRGGHGGAAPAGHTCVTPV